MFKRISIIAAALFITAAGVAIAAEDLGVKIYPGATKDEPSTTMQTQVLKAMGGGTGACYRTKDAVKKVADFYQKDGFKPMMAGPGKADEAMLQKGEKLSMTIKFMKPLDNTNDTRICIAKK